MLQVHKAFKYMQKVAAADVVDTRYNVRVKRAGSTEWQRGVYLRNPLDTAAAPSFTVEIMPQLHEVCAWCALPLCGSHAMGAGCLAIWMHLNWHVTARGVRLHVCVSSQTCCWPRLRSGGASVSACSTRLQALPRVVPCLSIRRSHRVFDKVAQLRR